MKKLMSIVLIIQLLVSMMIVNANAATNGTGTIQMSMDGRLVTFKVAQLSINDQLIQSDVPPVIHNDRTLVPLRIIMENIQADVNWNSGKQEVVVKTVDKEIVLQINNSIAMVNGVNSPLPDAVAPKLINGRTMVPIRFVAETIGLEVNWNNSTQTVLLKHKPVEIPNVNAVRASAINVGNGYLPEIRIKTHQEVSYQVSNLTNPTRLVVDLKNTRFDLIDKRNMQADGVYRLPIIDSGVKLIRMSQFKTQPLETRVVLELDTAVTHKISYDPATGDMVISFTNHVKSVKTEQQNMKEVVVIEGDNVSNYNVLRFNNPERLVVDIKDAQLSGANYNISVNGRVAKNLRVSQFAPDSLYKPDDKIVRVVIDLQEQQSYADFHFEVKNNQLLVHLEGKPLSNISYAATSWTVSKLVFRGNSPTRYQVKRLANSNIIEILVPKTNEGLQFSDIEVNDHMIKKLTVDRTSSNQHDRILIEMEKDVDHRLLSPELTKDLEVEFKHKNKYREILVVIDPGHGGTDPGAVSSKLKESHVVLDVSLRLNKLLTDAGFRTHMTRSTDVFINLDDRVKIANEVNGDVFVSVHANSFTNPSAQGIENLYYPSESDPKDNRNNKRLAEIFQDNMIKDLGGTNRGIVARSGVKVLRDTKMPAVLTEMGFISNPNEEAKLATEAYRQKVAESLYKAIVQYFEETRFK